MPKIEIEVLFTRVVTEQGSKVIEVNVPADIADDEDEISSWLEVQVEEGKIDAEAVIYKGSDLSDSDTDFQVDEVHPVE